MAWFKVDDRFFSHPKVLALRAGPLEDAALALWTKAGSWSASMLTDGYVPSFVVETLASRTGKRAASELVRVGLWEETHDGFRFLSWDEYQPTKGEIEEKRSKNAKKIANWREKRRAGDEGSNQPCNPVTRETCNPVTDPPVTAPCNPSVTLPPTRSRSRSQFPPSPPEGGEVEAEGSELPEVDLSASAADLRFAINPPPPEPPPPGVRYFETPTVLDDFAKQWARESSRRGGPGLAPYAPPTPRDAKHAKSIVERALAATEDDPAKAGALYERELRGYLRHHVDPSTRRDALGRVVSSPLGHFASGFGGWAHGR